MPDSAAVDVLRDGPPMRPIARIVAVEADQRSAKLSTDRPLATRSPPHTRQRPTFRSTISTEAS